MRGSGGRLLPMRTTWRADPGSASTGTRPLAVPLLRLTPMDENQSLPLAMISGGLVTDLIGLGLGAAIWGVQRWRHKSAGTQPS